MYKPSPTLLLGTSFVNGLFPARYVDRGKARSFEALPEAEHRRSRSRAQLRYGYALTGGLFMVSQDGVRFKRWNEASLRPSRLITRFPSSRRQECLRDDNIGLDAASHKFQQIENLLVSE